MNAVRKLYCRVFQSVFHVAIPFFPYRNPETHNSLSDIPSILQKEKINNVLIVTDKGLVKAGLLDLLTDVLDRSGIHYAVYQDVVPNPTIHNVEEARAVYLNSQAQGVIALGGGSAMDCAKACAARITNSWLKVPQMKGILRVWRPLPRLIAIPTTAGTGSETTLAAVISNSETHEKYSLMSFPLIPHYAIHDYRLTTGLPKHITSTTGMDALTHAVEAFIGGSTTRETRAMAIEATRLVHQYLYRAYQDGTDAEARQQMLRASYCAGVAFTQSYVGYVHAVAHSLSALYGTAHGLANAVLLPIVLRAYGASAHKRLARLAREAGVVSAEMVSNYQSDQEVATAFIQWIQELNDKMDIPHNLPEIQPQDIKRMASLADKEANPLYPVPVLWDAEQLKNIYHLAK